VLERKRLLPAVPEDFCDYLAAIQDANAIRAETTRGQAQRAAAAASSSSTMTGSARRCASASR
jgi:hypothetical protein